MKRLMVLILTVLLLGGCAGETMTIDPLDKDRDFGAFHAAAPRLKLNCFSAAIRAHFDTENWPEKTHWEQALE